jgi:hypothetical protein
MSKSTKTTVAQAAATLVKTTAPSGATITSTAPTAPVVHHLTATDTAALAQYGAAFAASFTSIDLNVAKVQGDASALALILCRCGADKVFSDYTDCRTAFIAGMADKSAEAAERYWQRAYAAARDTKEGATLPKGGPASTDPNAVKSAKQREAAKTAAAADTRTAAELLAAATAAGKAGDLIGAGKLATLSVRKAGADARATKLANEAATKAQADSIRAAVKRMQDAGNVAALAAVLKLALKHSPAPVAVTA